MQISPDRKFLAYEAAGQITLQPADADDPKTQIPNGLRPVWSKDGKRIYFFGTADGVVRVTGVPFAGGHAGAPVAHFECERCQELDLMPEGRFAVLRAVSSPNPPATISVILQGPVSAPR